MPLVVGHTSRRLVLGTSLGVDTILPEQSFLLFLDQAAARAAPRCKEVHPSSALDAVLGSHFPPLHGLENALEATAAQSIPPTAITVGITGWDLALYTSLGLAKEEAWAESTHQAGVDG